MSGFSMVNGIFVFIYFFAVAAVVVLAIWIAVLLIKFLRLKNAELRLRLARDHDVVRDDGGPTSRMIATSEEGDKP